MNRLTLFARTLSLGLATVALPAFVASKVPEIPSHPASIHYDADQFRQGLHDGAKAKGQPLYPKAVRDNWEAYTFEYQAGYMRGAT